MGVILLLHNIVQIFGSYFLTLLYMSLLNITMPTNGTHFIPEVSLTMDNNELTGSFPSEIGQLTDVKYLSFSSNSFSGTIPDEIGSLENIESFDTSLNFINGKLPDIFDRLVYLKSFNVALNYLSGSLPQTLLYNSTVLNSLNISRNIFGGSEPLLPEDLGQMTSLTSLDLSTNQFSGPIPESIGEMKNLVELRLDQNFLTGPLPASVNQLADMKILSVSGNFISALPGGLTSLTQLEQLQLSINSIVEIPEEVFNGFQNLGEFFFFL